MFRAIGLPWMNHPLSKMDRLDTPTAPRVRFKAFAKNLWGRSLASSATHEVAVKDLALGIFARSAQLNQRAG